MTRSRRTKADAAGTGRADSASSTRRAASNAGGANAVGDLSGYAVGVAVCGGIAAYKVCTVVSALAQRGAEVTVAMTESATRFVGVVTFGALSGRPVLTSLWTDGAYFDPQHIRLTESWDVLLIAPATYNIIGKIASGVADDVVSTLAAAVACPVLMAPAMNSRMWENPICRRNVDLLRETGISFIEPQAGWLACRTQGPGRLAEPEHIIDTLAKQLIKTAPKSSSKNF